MEMLIILVVGIAVVALIFGVVSKLDTQADSAAHGVGAAPNEPQLTVNLLPWNGVVLASGEDALCVVLPWLDISLAGEPIEGEIEFSDILLIDHVDGTHDVERLEAQFPDAEIFRTSEIEAGELGSIDWERNDTGIEVVHGPRRVALGIGISIYRLVKQPFVNVLIGGFKPEVGPELFEAPDAMQALSQVEGLINYAAVPPGSAEFVSILFDAIEIPIVTVPPMVGPPYVDQHVYLASVPGAELPNPAVAESAIRYLCIEDRLDEAKVLIDHALERFPDAGILHYHDGVLALMEGEPNEAVKAFTAATTAEVPFPEAYNSLSACYAVEGDLDKAKDAIDAARDALPDDTIVLQNSARLLFLRGDVEDAEALLEEHNAAFPAMVAAALRNAEPPTAHLFPHHAHVAKTWAKMMDKLGRFEESEALYKRAMALNPNDIESIADFGVSLSEQERDEEAIAWYREHIDNVLGGELLHYNLGNALRRVDKNEDARASYETCLEIHPEWVEARIAMTAVCCDLGEKDEARVHLEKLDPTSLDPDLMDALDEMVAD